MKTFTSILFLITFFTVTSFASSTNIATKDSLVIIETIGSVETVVEDASTQKISFTVVCMKEADINSKEFVALLKAFDLKKENAVQIDGGLFGINLSGVISKIDSPVTLGKKLSLATDNILMVKVNNTNNNIAA